MPPCGTRGRARRTTAGRDRLPPSRIYSSDVRVPSADDLIRRIRDARIGRYGVGIDENALAELEQGLGVLSLCGLSQLPEAARLAVSSDRRRVWRRCRSPVRARPQGTERAGSERRRPSALVSFAGEPNGAIHFLDTSHEGPYESPVYDGRAGEPAAPVYAGGHDFASWLWMRIDEPSEGNAER